MLINCTKFRTKMTKYDKFLSGHSNWFIEFVKFGHRNFIELRKEMTLNRNNKDLFFYFSFYGENLYELKYLTHKLYFSSGYCFVPIHDLHQLPAFCFCSYQKAAGLHNYSMSCQQISAWRTPMQWGIMSKHLCLVFHLSTGLSYQFEDTRNTFPDQEYLQVELLQIS